MTSKVKAVVDAAVREELAKHEDRIVLLEDGGLQALCSCGWEGRKADTRGGAEHSLVRHLDVVELTITARARKAARAFKDGCETCGAPTEYGNTLCDDCHYKASGSPECCSYCGAVTFDAGLERHQQTCHANPSRVSDARD